MWFFCLWGWLVVCFFALQDLTLVGPDVCGPLSLSLCLVCSTATFFSLSFFLSGAGETQAPFGVWVSPCVFAVTISHYDPYFEDATYTKVAARPCFFFFPTSFVFLVVVGRGLSCLFWASLSLLVVP